jgi:hypothetical protein
MVIQLRAFIDPANVHVYVVIHFCDSTWSFLSGHTSVAVYYRLFIYVLPLEIQLSRGGVEIKLQ